MESLKPSRRKPSGPDIEVKSLVMKRGWLALVGACFVLGAQIAWGGPQGRVSLSQASFVSPEYELTNKKDYQLFGAGIDTLSGVMTESEIDDSLQAQVRGVVAPGASVLNYLNVSQLYWKENVLSVGRKKINWSQLDENFTLGSIQPVFKWNPLQWEQQGLTGLFIHLETTDALPWGVTLFGSGLFIPNQGAGYELKDGTFQASNPYFKAPPEVAEVNDQDFKIHYDLKKPEVQDIVFKQSFAGRVFLGKEHKGPYVQIAHAYKPQNELNLGFIGYAPYLENQANAAVKQVNVEILPVLSYHHISSADLFYSNKYIKAGLSGIYEVPTEPEFESNWTYATFTNSTLISPFVDLKFKDLELNFAYLTVNGGESVPVGPESHQANKFIPRRYPYRNAGSVGARYQFRFKRHENLAFSTKYLRGEAGEFDLWNTQASYQWQERWAMTLAGQLVAVENNSNGQATAYNSYVNNDLVAIGVSYVF